MSLASGGCDEVAAVWRGCYTGCGSVGLEVDEAGGEGDFEELGD